MGISAIYRFMQIAAAGLSKVYVYIFNLQFLSGERRLCISNKEEHGMLLAARDYLLSYLKFQ
jgi:hypothetical protein